MTYRSLVKDTIRVMEVLLEKDEIPFQISQIANLINELNLNNKIVAIFGNGGSAADAQHFVGELVCSYHKKERKPFKAFALTSNSPIITAWSNDYNFDAIFSRQIESLNETLGLALGLSTSGNSANVINGLKKAKELGIATCLICGLNHKERSFIDFVIKIPSSNTAIVQTITQVIYHSICEELEEK